MKLPSHVTVAGVKYKLSYCSQLAQRMKYGECNAEEKTIKIADTLKKNPTLLKQTILHEIKHAHQAEYGLMQAFDWQILEIDAETTANVFNSIFDIRFKSSPNLKKKR